MASGGFKALRAAIKEGAFAPTYYFHGEDDYLKGESLADVVRTASDPATRDFNLETLRGGDVDGEQLGSILGTPPMLADRRVVVVKDVNLLKKDARAALDKYLARPAADLLLVLVAPAGVKEDSVLSAATVAVDFEPLAGNRIPAWIEYYVKETLHTTITPTAVTHLQEAAGTDLAQLKVELDKLASFSGPGGIDEAGVSAVVGVRPGETMGALLDAIVHREARAALALLPGVLQQPKTTGVQVIMALTVQTLALGFARAAQDRGTPPGRLRQDLYGFLKSGPSYVGRAWGEAVNSWATSVDRWPAAAIDTALEALLDADVAIKDTRVSSEEQVLTNLVLALCGGAHARHAA